MKSPFHRRVTSWAPSFHSEDHRRFLVDDKGLLILLVFGLPPLVHTDDPLRAVRRAEEQT